MCNGGTCVVAQPDGAELFPLQAVVGEVDDRGDGVAVVVTRTFTIITRKCAAKQYIKGKAHARTVTRKLAAKQYFKGKVQTRATKQYINSNAHTRTP